MVDQAYDQYSHGDLRSHSLELLLRFLSSYLFPVSFPFLYRTIYNRQNHCSTHWVMCRIVIKDLGVHLIFFWFALLYMSNPNPNPTPTSYSNALLAEWRYCGACFSLPKLLTYRGVVVQSWYSRLQSSSLSQQCFVSFLQFLFPPQLWSLPDPLQECSEGLSHCCSRSSQIPQSRCVLCYGLVCVGDKNSSRHHL